MLLEFKMRKIKIKCKRGHLFSKLNTYLNKQGARNCLKCRYIHSIARSGNPGIGSGGFNKLKTHCVNGHLFSKKNTWIRCSGSRKERRCRICSRFRIRKSNANLKRKLFELLNGKCNWRGCVVTDFDMLTLDHKNDDGYRYRIRGITSGNATYRAALKEGVPKSKYQLLCANHNLKKELLKIRTNVIN